MSLHVGHPVNLTLDEMQALIAVIEQEGVADEDIDTAYVKLCEVRARRVEVEVKNLLSSLNSAGVNP